MAGQVFPRREAAEAPYITSWRESINNLQPQPKVLGPKHGKNSVLTSTSTQAVKLHNTFTQHPTTLRNYVCTSPVIHYLFFTQIWFMYFEFNFMYPNLRLLMTATPRLGFKHYTYTLFSSMGRVTCLESHCRRVKLINFLKSLTPFTYSFMHSVPEEVKLTCTFNPHINR